MGSSSKKHKTDKRRKRSRSLEDKEKHRSHKRHKSHRRRYEEVTTISSDSSDVEEVEVIPPPPPIISSDVADTSAPSDPPESSSTSGKSRDSLSIAETNILRAKLGLKPLQVPSNTAPKENDGVGEKRIAEDGTDMGEFVHKPATNARDDIRRKKIMERLTEKKEKRAYETKLKSIKGLGESDSEDDTRDWVKKSREKEKLKKEAEKRAKMLEELDEEFGIGALVEEERKSERKTLYSGKDLRGLRVGHALDGFEEGNSTILTLKDKDVLDDDTDTLINVNMIDDERHKKNVQRKKKSKVFDDEMEVEPEDRISSVLSKYDEEIDGEKEDSFTLGEELSDAERARKKLEIKKRLLSRNAIDLSTDLHLASDYYTEEEASAKFKKPGKLKKIRKKLKAKPLKAEDLLPKQESTWPTEDLGCRRREPKDTGEVDMEIDVKLEVDPVLDIDDLAAPSDDLYNIKIDPDEAELELQLALNKARKLKQKEKRKNPVENMAQELIENGSENNQGPGGNIVLNSTAEFCRTLGEIPTYGQSGNREEEEELLDFEREMKEEQQRWEEEVKTRGAWSQVDNDEKVSEAVPEDVAILDEEPDVGKGIGGALRLALSKGYLEKETASNRPSASRFAHLQAQNYSIEDKAHGDDDKFGRRDRFSGPTTDFKEKDHYKPNVKLDYIDDDGRILSSKEAFRYLSHKFHGKGPGKNKVEKRMKKNEQDGLMKQMSSTDTPLRTLTMLQQKQKETQSAFVVLSGKGQIGSAATISKMK